MKPTLTDLAVRFNSDKLHSHSYVPFYEQLFVGRTVRRLLEIGIGFKDLMQPFVSPEAPYVHGSSLRMWEEYFPETQIFGCDVREETLIKTERIRTMWCDQSSGESLANMVMKFCWDGMRVGGVPSFVGFDVIIDDGSHQTAHQLLTFDCLYPRLNEGGVYVIEDCQEPERLAAHTGGTIHRFDKRPDDCLVVVRR